MKSVLMIAYYFPPDGSAGVYRPLRFVRHLPARGWQPSVVTANGNGYARYDPQLMELVPKDVEIVPVSGDDIWQTIQAKRARRVKKRMAGSAENAAKLQRAHVRPARSLLRKVVHTAEAWFYYPDLARPWIAPATRATVTICQQRRPNVVMVTGGPWSSFLVAHEVFQRTGVPYVLDFRDSWTLTSNEDFEALRPRWADRKDRRLLDGLFRDAQAVIFRYDSEAECYWRAYPDALNSAQIHIIPNGYEGAIERFQVAPGDRCTIVYAGTVIPYRFDTLLEGLSLLQRSFPAEARQLRLLFVGEGVERVGQAAASHGLTDMVETLEPVSSQEVARLQRNAHGLLLLGVRPYQGFELCGSKLFGYLKAGRPILGVLPADESRNVLQRVGVSTVADWDSPLDIVKVIRDVLAAWSARTLSSLLPDPDRCRVYEAENQTRAVVRALEGLPALTPFIPGRAEIPDSLKRRIGDQGWINQ
jgi:hypothetical protein